MSAFVRCNFSLGIARRRWLIPPAWRKRIMVGVSQGQFLPPPPVSLVWISEVREKHEPRYEQLILNTLRRLKYS